MSGLSLRDRVTLATVLIVAAGLVVLSVVFNVLLSSRLNADASNVLRSRAAAQLATLDLSHGGVRAVEGPGDTALDRDTWVLAGGRVIERPPLAPRAVTREVVRLAAAGRTADATVGTTRLRAAPIRGPAGERRGAVVVGVSLVPYDHTRQIVLVSTAILSVLLLAGTAIAVRLAVRSALRPVAEMTAHAADWSEHDLHRRFHL